MPAKKNTLSGGKKKRSSKKRPSKAALKRIFNSEPLMAGNGMMLPVGAAYLKKHPQLGMGWFSDALGWVNNNIVKPVSSVAKPLLGAVSTVGRMIPHPYAQTAATVAGKLAGNGARMMGGAAAVNALNQMSLS